MKRVIAIGDWLFEIKSIRAIRVEKYGKPYNGIASIEFIDGEAHVEGALSKAGWERSDTQAFEEFINSFQEFDFYVYSRFNKHDKKRLIKKRLKRK